MRKFPPLAADHPAVVDGTCCYHCRRRFKAGDETTLVATRPSSEEDWAKAVTGQAYNSEAELVHWDCREIP